MAHDLSHSYENGWAEGEVRNMLETPYVVSYNSYENRWAEREFRV